MASFLVTAVVAKMNPVLTDRPEYLHHYAYALRVWAFKAEQAGHPGLAVSQGERAYYLRTLAR
jgi:hypothetical protein